MLTNVRKALGVQYAKWQFRKTKDSVQELTDFFRRSKSFLVVLPAGYDDAQTASTFLRKRFDVLKNVHLTIVTSGVRATALSDAHRSHVIRLGEVDINGLFLPRTNVLQRVWARSYDVALDMNLDFVLHAAYICKASRALVRVGVECVPGKYFYNVQLNLDRSEPPRDRYTEFVRCLEMF